MNVEKIKPGPLVYLLSDADGRVLYVGTTSNFHRRMGEHAASKPWWAEVCTTKLIAAESAAEALALESELIAEICPRHNKQGNDQATVEAIEGNPLLDVDELRSAYARLIGFADANRAQAQKVRERCFEQYGVDLASKAVSA